MYNNSNQIKLGVVLTYISMGLGFVVSLIYTPIMIRLLGQSEYGLYNLTSSVIAYLGVLNFGFGSTYIRYYSRFKAKKDNNAISKLNGMFLVIFSILALIVLFSGVTLSFFPQQVFGNNITNEEMEIAKVLVIILSINLAVTFPNIVFVSYIIANEKFIFLKVISLINVFINPFVVIPLLYMGYGSIGMALGITSVSFILQLSQTIYALKKLKIHFIMKSFDKALFKEMSVFSFFIFASLVIDQINWNVDKFILGRYHGTVAVAVYSIAALFNTYYLQLSTAISNVFVPRVHTLINLSDSKNEITKLFTKVGRVQFLVVSLFLSGFIFFGKPFIGWWAGENYSSSYYIIVILISAVTIPIIQNLGIEIQRAYDLHKFRTVIYFIIAIINVFVSIPLAIHYQGIGSAIGTAFALLIGNGLIMNIYYHKTIGLDMIYFWKEIFKLIPGFILPILTAFFLLAVTNIYLVHYFLIDITIYVTMFFISFWYFGLNNFEKELIKKPISIFIKKMKGY